MNLPIAVHYEGTTMRQLFDRGVSHLWDFSTERPRLVQEAFDTSMS